MIIRRAVIVFAMAMTLPSRAASPDSAAFLDPARWTSEDFVALWQRSSLEDAATVSRAYPVSKLDPLGLEAQAVCARTSSSGSSIASTK